MAAFEPAISPATFSLLLSFFTALASMYHTAKCSFRRRKERRTYASQQRTDQRPSFPVLRFSLFERNGMAMEAGMRSWLRR